MDRPSGMLPRMDMLKGPGQGGRLRCVRRGARSVWTGFSASREVRAWALGLFGGQSSRGYRWTDYMQNCVPEQGSELRCGLGAAGSGPAVQPQASGIIPRRFLGIVLLSCLHCALPSDVHSSG